MRAAVSEWFMSCSRSFTEGVQSSMAEINLRDYLAKLGDWLKEGAADQVIWHARHILQYYPKNVEAYRYIGQALLEVGRLDEANAVLRRVLSVVPDDQISHKLLSEVQERTGQTNLAIWHMERAFEQDPANRDIIEQLQRLYREYRNINMPRIQLTTAAAARQHMRGGSLDRAVETLRSAIERTSQRSDLRLLLAQALWQRGERIDAAEVALDVLQSYPDCLSANRMLAELWLSEARPSDAQRFVNKIESIDPYLALGLVQQTPVDPDAFRLPELDYQRTANAEMVNSRLDWLEGIDTVAPSELAESDRAGHGSLEQLMAGVPSGDADTALSGTEDDWLNQLDAIELNYKVNTSTLQANTSPLVGNEESAAVLAEPEELPATNTLSFNWAGDSEAEFPPSSEDDPFAWLRSTEPETESTSGMSTPSGADEDPLSWARQSGIEIHDAVEVSPSPDDEDMMLEEQTEEPIGWLRAYNTEAIANWADQQGVPEDSLAPDDLYADRLVEVDDTVSDSLFDADLPFPDLDDDFGLAAPKPDPLEHVVPQTMPLPERFSFQTESPATDALDDWKLTDSLLNESLGLEDLTGMTSAASDSFLDALDAVEAIDALHDASSPTEVQYSEESGVAAWPPGTPERGNEMPDQNSPDFDWLDEEPQEPNSTSSGATGMLNWLAREEAQAEEPATPFGETGTTPDGESTGMTGVLDWLAQSEDPTKPERPAPAESSPEPSTGSTGMLNWLSQNRPLPPTMPLSEQPAGEGSPENEPLEWLSQLDDQEETSAGDAEAEQDASSGATGMLDWLGHAEAIPPATDVSEEPISETPMEDWLAEIMPGDTEAQLIEPEAEASSEIENLWATEETAPSEEPGEEMDWLATSLNAEPSPVAEQESASELTEPWAEEMLASEEQGDELDWLATSLNAEPGAVAQHEPEAPSTSELTEPWAEEALASEETGDELDWLAASLDAEPSTDAQTEPQAEIQSEFTESWAEEAAAPEELGDEMDWLATSLNAEPDAVAQHEPQAQTQSELDRTEADETAAEEMDWLATSLNAEPGVVSAHEPDASTESEFGSFQPESAHDNPEPISAQAESWALDADEEDAIAASLLDEGSEQALPGWIEETPVAAAASTYVDDEWQDDEAYAAEDESAVDNEYEAAFDEMPEVAAIAPAENAPDWLNAMVPGLDIDYEAQEETPIETEFVETAQAMTPAAPTDFGWLAAIVDEETRPQHAAADGSDRMPRFIFSRPPVWLRMLLERRSSEIVSDDDLPAWLR